MLCQILEGPVIEGDLPDHHDDQENNKRCDDNSQADKQIDASNWCQNVVKIIQTFLAIVQPIHYIITSLPSPPSLPLMQVKLHTWL